jgi:hypothetical protein
MKRVWAMIVLSIFLVGCGGAGEDVQTSVSGTGLEITGNLSDEGGDEVAVTDAEEDECLVGSWRMTNFSEYMEAMVADVTSDISMDSAITATDTGSLIITFDGETMSMSEEDFVVTVSILGTTVPVEVDATGSVGYSVSDGQIINETSGQVDAEGDSGGLSYSVDMTNWASRSVGYECDGNSLVWEAGDNFEVDLTFERI